MPRPKLTPAQVAAKVHTHADCARFAADYIGKSYDGASPEAIAEMREAAKTLESAGCYIRRALDAMA